MKKLKIKDWGIEWEIPNAPLLKYKDFIEKHDFIRGNVEKTIINEKEGIFFFNDIQGNLFDYGGELNSKPSKNWLDIYNNMKEIHNELKLSRENYDKNYFNLHIHIKFEDFTIEDSKDFFQWIMENNKDITQEFFKRYQNFPAYKKVTFYDTTISKLFYNLSRSKNWEEFNNQYFLKTSATMNDYTEKQIIMLKLRYIRPYINLQQILHTNTIEFRCFNISKIEEAENCFKWIEELINSYNEKKKFTFKIYDDTILEKRFDLKKVLSFNDYWKNRKV